MKKLTIEILMDPESESNILTQMNNELFKGEVPDTITVVWSDQEQPLARDWAYAIGFAAGCWGRQNKNGRLLRNIVKAAKKHRE